MKTLKQVLREYPDKKRLINAVINQLGGWDDETQNTIENIASHGANTGHSGFTFYSDTIAFAMKNRKAIVAWLEEQAEELGEGDVVEMVSHFGVFRSSPMDKDDRQNLYRYLGGCKCKETTIPNLMAWYAAEEVCRLFEN